MGRNKRMVTSLPINYKNMKLDCFVPRNDEVLWITNERYMKLDCFVPRNDGVTWVFLHYQLLTLAKADLRFTFQLNDRKCKYAITTKLKY